MKINFYNRGQSLIGIIIVLVVVGLISGGLYYYLSKQIPEIPEITEKPVEEEIVKPEEEVVTPPPEEELPKEEVTPKEKPPEEVKPEISGKCTIIFENGPPSEKINIYFYESGFNSNMQVYDDYVKKATAYVFGGSFKENSYPGIEPFKSLQKEFNVFSYKNKEGDCGKDVRICSFIQNIYPDLEGNCPGFIPASDFQNFDGNYNIFILPYLGAKTERGSATRITKRIDSETLRVGSAPTWYANLNLYPIEGNLEPLPHELGHIIGFFDEEYTEFDLYLGAGTFHPNVDSFSCTKWCQGVDTQSACYQRYTGWLECFKDKFIDKSNEIQEVLQENNLNYTTPNNYSWWGTCFNARNINICGEKIATIVESHIRKPDQEWVSNWEYCKNQYPEAGPRACNLGLNCGENGCYVGGSYSRFLPSVENEFIMGTDYSSTARFNKHDEEILRYNIFNKIRYIDVENIE